MTKCLFTATGRRRARVAWVGSMAALTVLALLSLAACEPELVEPDVEPLGSDTISGERLWERISEEAPYESYSFWPNEEGVQPGQAPHGPFHRIFVNRPLRDSIPIADRTAPDGSIIVKENLNTSQELVSYTVMAKVDGYDPENGDWFWAVYGPDGMVRAAGAMDSCIVCHEGLVRNDYIIVYPLDKPAPTE